MKAARCHIALVAIVRGNLKGWGVRNFWEGKDGEIEMNILGEIKETMKMKIKFNVKIEYSSKIVLLTG